MRKTNGHVGRLDFLVREGSQPSAYFQVIFGGSIAYVPQSPWIRNATLRENVVFGQHDDEQKYISILDSGRQYVTIRRFWDIIRACSLESDIAMLPQREHTEIGEKGINLSG